jgi:16S rRNA (guanine527-N7)-methyltransferase
VKHGLSPEELVEAAAAMGVQLPRRAADRHLAYMAFLSERAASLGLISRADLPRLYERHLLDSLRAAAVFTEEDSLAFDLGSGAGLPGIVLAITLERCEFVLIEPRRIRVGFLELVVEWLGLANVEVAPVPAEEFPTTRLADVITARAFAPLERTWRSASRLLRPSGRLIYFAGESLDDPLAEAEKAARSGAPAEVTAQPVLARSPPLVIMARR